MQLHKTEQGQAEYGEFLHAPKKKFTDFGKMNLTKPNFLFELRYVPSMGLCNVNLIILYVFKLCCFRFPLEFYCLVCEFYLLTEFGSFSEA